MNWVSIINYGAAAFTVCCAVFSVRNTVKFERWAKKQRAEMIATSVRSSELLHELTALDPSIDMHRLRFQLFALLSDEKISQEVKTHISTALAFSQVRAGPHGNA